MRTYNIVPKEISVGTSTVNAIALGESGRGRKQKLVRCPMEFTELTYKMPKPGVSGNVRLEEGYDDGLLMRISAAGAYIRGANGNISVHPADAAFVTVVAMGHGAFGDAGRTGTWDDLLLAVTTNPVTFRVKPSRGDAYILQVDEDCNVQKLTYAEAELLDIDVLDSTVSSRGQFVRLGE